MVLLFETGSWGIGELIAFGLELDALAPFGAVARLCPPPLDMPPSPLD